MNKKYRHQNGKSKKWIETPFSIHYRRRVRAALTFRRMVAAQAILCGLFRVDSIKRSKMEFRERGFAIANAVIDAHVNTLDAWKNTSHLMDDLRFAAPGKTA